jgi:hypothetical protein
MTFLKRVPSVINFYTCQQMGFVVIQTLLNVYHLRVSDARFEISTALLMKIQVM